VEEAMCYTMSSVCRMPGGGGGGGVESAVCRECREVSVIVTKVSGVI
jgi:hypothetical protein